MKHLLIKTIEYYNTDVLKLNLSKPIRRVSSSRTPSLVERNVTSVYIHKNNWEYFHTHIRGFNRVIKLDISSIKLDVSRPSKSVIMGEVILRYPKVFLTKDYFVDMGIKLTKR